MRLLLKESSIATRNALKFPNLATCLPWLWRVRFVGRLFSWSEKGSVPFVSSYRLTNSRNSFRRSSTSSILEPNLYVTICTNNPVLPSLSDVPYTKAQLSVSFEHAVSSFPHDFPCSFLCEHRDVHVVESPSPLLVIVSLLSAGRAKQDRAYPRIRWTWSPSRRSLYQVRAALAFRLSCPLGAVSTPTVPSFSQLPWVLSPLRSSRCSTTVDELLPFVQRAHRADVSASQLLERMPSPLNTTNPR